MTLDEAVVRIAAATGRPYRYESETLEEAFARRWREGMSGEQIETWISWYQAIVVLASERRDHCIGDA